MVDVVVLVGTGSPGEAIARRIGDALQASAAIFSNN
jgi:predicted dinucleotide-binding enzyme